ncbi:CHASE2 domain-containing protein [Sulfitobacter sp. JBTF-M27]|uniref:CHASE2 domain-containing protein n=1 Tax=Sulfitobacter sediminilitoris TaxID=2698830 RepID=A0A6P0CG38_9RHOB|nr:adenylate/guanylate cyclase domain-containing protein [Sulfitobacter sediminilitoris]NEK25112.1 CHASE2 domain-containing protein [Sulfitobacter sediminilitoris]
MKLFLRIVRRFDWARALATGLLALLLLVRVVDHELIQTFRYNAFDFYQQVKPRSPEPFPVTIIDVDDQSLEELGQWPWPRTTLADLVDKATAAGAVALAFDVIFADPDRLSPENIALDNKGLPEEIKKALRAMPSNDSILADAIGRSRVIVGETSIRRSVASGQDDVQGPKVEYAFLGPNPEPFMMKFPDLVQNMPTLDAKAAGRGIFTVRPDSDGVYRRVPLVMLVDGQVRMGLSVELLRIATGGGAFAIKSNDAGVDGVIVARQLISTDSDGTVWPYFAHSSRDRFVSASDLVLDRLPPNRLRGHLVFVGTSAIGLEDFRATPLGTPMPGVEIHAQVLENILGKTMLVRPNYSIAVELLTIVLLGLVIIVLVPKMGAAFVLMLTGTLISGYVLFSYVAFQNERILLDPTYPAFSAIILAIFMSTMNYLREERERQRIRSAFGQYVSPDLVTQLSDNPERLILGGERRPLSILFSDVRGFTTISESFRDDPAGLTQLMNRFLTVLSDGILSFGGTIDKFMGDAVMAFWNAPLDEPDHARLSCRAALKMLSDVNELNEFRKVNRRNPDKKFHQIDVGIGINTGDCIVGNMGSDTRFDYTALGDAVNLASRLEGQSKTYGVGIILGPETANHVKDDFAVLELDLIRVKGKTEPAQVFGLFGDETLRAAPEFQRLETLNNEMLDAYRGQRWSDAQGHLKAMQEVLGGLPFDLQTYIEMYSDRVQGFKENPPGQSWDGVFVAASK